MLPIDQFIVKVAQAMRDTLASNPGEPVTLQITDQGRVKEFAYLLDAVAVAMSPQNAAGVAFRPLSWVPRTLDGVDFLFAEGFGGSYEIAETADGDFCWSFRDTNQSLGSQDACIQAANEHHSAQLHQLVLLSPPSDTSGSEAREEVAAPIGRLIDEAEMSPYWPAHCLSQLKLLFKAIVTGGDE